MAAWRVRGYAVGDLLGRGASSEVWRAKATSSGDPVALKRLFLTDAEQIRRAHAEAALLTVLDHPNLVRLHAVVPTADAAVLVLDLADGGSLADLLAARGRLTPGEVVTAIAPVAAALAYVHGHGIVHGDLSPANVLFTPRGVALLADLGVARLTGDLSDAESTPAYVDPAVASGCVPTAVSDVFMLGAVALHALTGAAVWPGASAGESLSAARAADVSGVPGRLAAAGVPGEMAAVVLRALVTDPVRRCSAADFALDLRRCATPVAVELRAGRTRPAPVAGRVRRAQAAREAAAGPAVRVELPKRRVVYDPRHAAPAGPERRPPVPVARVERVPPAGLRSISGAGDGVNDGGVVVPGWRAPLPEVAPAESASPGLPPTVAVRRARPVLPRPPRRRVPRGRVAVAALVALVAVMTAVLLAVLAPQQHEGGAEQRPVAASVDWPAALRVADAARARAFATRSPAGLNRVYVPGRLRAVDAALLARLVPVGCRLTGAVTRFDQVRVRPARGRADVVARAAVAASTLRCRGRADRWVAPVAPVRVRVELVSTAAGVRIADLRPL